MHTHTHAHTPSLIVLALLDEGLDLLHEQTLFLRVCGLQSSHHLLLNHSPVAAHLQRINEHTDGRGLLG